MEIFGFLYCLSIADMRNSDNAIHTYITLRIILLIASILIFNSGKKHKSSSLKVQGGLFLAFNLLTVGFVIVTAINGF